MQPGSSGYCRHAVRTDRIQVCLHAGPAFVWLRDKLLYLKLKRQKRKTNELIYPWAEGSYTSKAFENIRKQHAKKNCLHMYKKPNQTSSSRKMNLRSHHDLKKPLGRRPWKKFMPVELLTEAPHIQFVVGKGGFWPYPQALQDQWRSVLTQVAW